MNIKDLKTKTKVELEKMLEERAESLNKFKFGISGSKIKNVREGRNLKLEIAQILTIIKESKTI
ncbi:MAG: 50S ribosomal protein L29 [Candidatus Pacebacteria bacterium]|nr:50S ribosomal protein L29 [Candidatus Paceibacterota bacterium]